MKILKDVFYSDEEISAKSLDASIPDGKTEAVFMYMHGGGLERGDKSRDFEAIAEFLAKKVIAFVSINYRMYPDAVCSHRAGPHKHNGFYALLLELLPPAKTVPSPDRKAHV